MFIKNVISYSLANAYAQVVRVIQGLRDILKNDE